MRLLVTGDIHYALKQYDWLLSVADAYDAVIIVGDMLEIASSVDPSAQVVVVRTYLAKLAEKARVIVCSGNHDLNALSASGERVADWLGDLQQMEIAVDGMRTWTGDAMVSVFPWWDGPEAKSQIAGQLARDAAESPEFWVWVYHAPPGENPTSWAGSRYFGDPALEDWIRAYNPTIVLCGHVHEAPFVDGGAWADRIGTSWVFNMGRQPGDVPCHIICDTSRRMALWHSYAGSEELDFGSPVARPRQLTAQPDWLTAADR